MISARAGKVGLETRGLARFLTYLFSPPLVLALVSCAVVFHASVGPLERLKWMALAMVSASLVPTLVAVVGVQRGLVTDFHMQRRSQRAVPLAISTVVVVTAFALAVVGSAPLTVLGMIGAMAFGALSTTLVTLRWKISFHTANLAGSAAVLALALGGAWLWMLAAVPVVAWARVKVCAHTPLQVLAGAFHGAAAAALAYWLVTSWMG